VFSLWGFVGILVFAAVLVLLARGFGSAAGVGVAVVARLAWGLWPVGFVSDDDLPPWKRNVIALVALDLLLDPCGLYGVGLGCCVRVKCDPGLAAVGCV
jgi:hypothetical protein